MIRKPVTGRPIGPAVDMSEAPFDGHEPDAAKAELCRMRAINRYLLVLRRDRQLRILRFDRGLMIRRDRVGPRTMV